MPKDDAILFSEKLGDFLDLPEIDRIAVEACLMQGNYKVVCEFIVRRIMEIDHLGVTND